VCDIANEVLPADQDPHAWGTATTARYQRCFPMLTIEIYFSSIKWTHCSEVL